MGVIVDMLPEAPMDIDMAVRPESCFVLNTAGLLSDLGVHCWETVYIDAVVKFMCDVV